MAAVSTSPARTIRPSLRNTAYAAGSLGTGVFSTVPTAILLYYCTEVLGLAPATAGFLVFVPKVWAIAWDPLVGAWSDRTRSPWGRRAPFLFVGAMGVAICFAALFSPPLSLAPDALVLWMGGFYFLLATVYSIYAVPYIALPAEITSTDHERTTLVSWRMVAGMIGVLLGAAGAPMLAGALGGGRTGYATMSWVVAVVCMVAMLTSVRVAPHKAATSTVGVTVNFWQGARSALAASGFARLTASYYLLITAVGVVTAAMPYLVTKSLARPESDIGTALAVLLGGAVVTPPLWAWAANKFGERPSLFAAMGVFTLSASGAGAAVWLQAPWPVALSILGFAGFGFAGLQVIPFAMLAHLAHRESGAGGASNEATFTGIWTAGEKLGLASGPALVAATLAFAGDASIPILIAVAPACLATGAALLAQNGAPVSSAARPAS